MITRAGDLLRAADFPAGIQTASDVMRLGALLNPRLKGLETLQQQGVNALDNLDAQQVNFQVKTPASQFTLATLQNGWANVASNAPAGFYKNPLGEVFVRATMNSGTGGTVAFTLPVGYRTSDMITIAGDAFGAVHSEVKIGADGTVIPSTTTCFFATAYPCADGSAGFLSCFPQQIRIEDRRAPLSVLLLSCQDHSQGNPAGTPNSGTTTPSITATGLQWSYVAGPAGGPNVVSIDNIPGLALGRTYDVSVLVLFQ